MDGPGSVSNLSASQRIATLSVLAAMALAVLDAGIVNVALPSLSRHFSSSASDTILVVGAYQAALLVGLLPSAHVAGRFGQRPIFVGGIGLFCGAALLCALAPSLPLLVVARIVQGLGAAAVMALGVALLREALGSDRLGSAIGWNALTVALCSAAGPTVGTAILAIAPWPWLFVAGLPLGAAATIAARALPKGQGTRHAIDAPSIALHAAIVILFVVGTKFLATQALVAVALAGSTAPLLVLLVRRARGRCEPMFPADLLGRRSFAFQSSASVCCFIGQSIGMVALPFHLQVALSGDLLAIGLVITCWPAGVACTSFVAGRMKQAPDRATQCVAGATLLAAGLLLLANTPLSGGTPTFAAGAALCGVGFGLFQLANNRTLFLTAPPERAAAAGGVQGSARLTGQTLGTLFMSLVFAWASVEPAPSIGLVVAAAFALLAALVAGWGSKAAVRHHSLLPLEEG